MRPKGGDNFLRHKKFIKKRETIQPERVQQWVGVVLTVLLAFKALFEVLKLLQLI